MKNLTLLVCTLLVTAFSFAQKTTETKSFQALNSNLGATVTIVKSPYHKIEFSGDMDKVAFIDWKVFKQSLYLKSTKADTDYSNVNVTVYTPEVHAVSLTDGGKLTMEKFNKIDDFVASAVDSATVDLSNISFKNLVASATDGGRILYKSTRTLVSSTEDGGLVKHSGK